MSVETITRPSEREALDALSVALEHEPELSLECLREHVRERETATRQALEGEALTRACVKTQEAALGVLRARYSDAEEDLLQETIRSALVDDGGLSRRAVDLGAILRDGVPPVEYLPGELARRMVYAEGITGFTGHPDSGKTSLVARLALDAMRRGRHVVYLDFENGEGEAARRMAALGATADLLSEFLTYVPFPGAPDWREIGALWDEHPDAFGVWDSTRGILRSLGLDEDRASEVSRFLDPLAEFALSRAVPMALIDHVAKAATETTGYGRGSGDKLAAVQGLWYVKCVRDFSETEIGEIELVRWKGRAGGLSSRHRFEVGDGEGRLTFRRLDADLSPQGRMETAIIDYLRTLHPETASQREVEENVGGTATVVRDCVKALAAAEGRPVAAVEGGQYARYAYVLGDDREPGGPDTPALGF